MIGIIEYGAGNTASVINALRELDCDYILSDDQGELDKCSKIIFPGVGEASSAMKRLKSNGLDKYIQSITKPLLGICLGMQLLSNVSAEGNTSCLGIMNTSVEKFPSDKVKIPHMGWNRVYIPGSNLLFDNITNGEHFYFANSFYMPVSEYSSALTEYSIKFNAAVQLNNYYGVQFHPEKSGKAGLILLNNFVRLC